VQIALAEGPSQAQTSVRASEDLAARYGVRVGSSDAAPGWLTDSSRGCGEPFETEGVDRSDFCQNDGAPWGYRGVRRGHR
jgi:hypothetical protein